jgi:hypothetical protein
MTPLDSKPSAQSVDRRRTTRTKRYIGLLTCVAVIIGAAVILASTRPWTTGAAHPTQSVRYLGVFEPDAPESTSGISTFAQAINRQPNLVSYYSPWLEPFQTHFAESAAQLGATTVVQIDPKNVSLSDIASGRYDAYLRSYAAAVKSFGRRVVLSFGHEMNGNWYSWGYRHTPASVFVAAWRHIVTVFRQVGADKVSWLWTVNVVDKYVPIPNPAAWWPGKSYVNWVGIDGYYFSSSQSFAQVFGATIVDIRELTKAPIFIAETGASVAAGQPAKISDLFSGVEAYGLLGFLWFNADSVNASDGVALRWRIKSREALAAFRGDAKAFMTPSTAPGAGSPSP